MSRKQRQTLMDQTVHQSILGPVLRQTPGKGKKACGTKPKPEMLYAFTVKRPQQRVLNVNQISAQILGNSRTVFLGHVQRLLRHLDPRTSALCYNDTDSAIWAFAGKGMTLEPLLRDDLSEDVRRRFMVDTFEDPLSAKHQAGLLKIEGWFTAGLFRSTKAYDLRREAFDEATDETTTEENVRRFRSVPTKTHDHLPLRVFEQTDNSGLIRTHAMRPTADQVVMFEESRILSHALNTKRFVLVSRRRGFFSEGWG